MKYQRQSTTVLFKPVFFEEQCLKNVLINLCNFLARFSCRYPRNTSLRVRFYFVKRTKRNFK